MDGPLPLAPPARCAAPVGDDHCEPLIGEPLGRGVRRPGRQDQLRVRPAVRIEEHRERGGVQAVRSLRQQHRGRDRPRPGPQERDPRPHERRLGVVRDLRRSEDRVTLRSRSSVDDRTTTVRPPPHPVCTPGSTTRASVVAPSLNRQSPTLVASSTGLAVNSSDRPTTPTIDRTCRSGGVRGTLAATKRRAPSWSAVMTTRPSSSTAGAPCTSSTQVSSLSSNSTEVVIVGSSPTRGGQDLQPALVPALHRQHDALGLRPLHVDQVGKGGPVPRDLPPAAVERQHPQRHVGVGRPRGRVRVLQGGWSGRAGSLIHQRATGDVSTRVAARAEPSGDHQ